MSEYRDALPPERLHRYDEAVRDAARILAAWFADQQHGLVLPEKAA